MYNGNDSRGLAGESSWGPRRGCLMADELALPLGISLSSDVEVRADRATPLRARVRWVDPVDKKRCSNPY